jgi:L-alanine-DL-glutamate epimerase-like enolase superfamily enzyme
VFVDDEGITEWEEASSGPLAVATMIDEFREVLVGEDPGEIEKHWQTLYHYFHVRGGVVQDVCIQWHRDCTVGYQRPGAGRAGL